MRTRGSPRGRGRRRLLTRLLAVALLSFAIAGWVGHRGAGARDHVAAAAASLDRARTLVAAGDVVGAREQARRADVEARRARTLVDDPVWRALSSVPWAGSSARSARAVVDALADVTSDVLPPALDAAELASGPRLRGANGTVDLRVLETASALVTRSDDRAAAVRAEVRASPQRGVFPRVQDARGDLLSALDSLSRDLGAAQDALRLAPLLLGRDGPQDYLVLVQQTSESRGTGGLPGGFALLRADRGRLELRASGSNAGLVNGDVDPGADVPTDYVQRYADQGAFRIWQNVNLSPDVPTVASVIRSRWRAQGGGDLAGVVFVDGTALEQLLDGGPSLTFPGRAAVPVERLSDFLAIGQYAGYGLDDQRARKDALAIAVDEAARRLTKGRSSAPKLVPGLTQAVRSGHLRLTSFVPDVQRELVRAGVDGALPRGDSPVAYPVVVNASGSKLDHFLDRAVVYTLGRCSQGRRPSTVELTLTNRTPTAGLPAYVRAAFRDGRRVSTTDLSLLVSVYATKGAALQAASLDGRAVRVGNGLAGQHVSLGTESGLPVWQVSVTVPAGRALTLRLDLEEPAAAGEAEVRAQPLARPLRSVVNQAGCSSERP